MANARHVEGNIESGLRLMQIETVLRKWMKLCEGGLIGLREEEPHKQAGVY